MAKHSTTSPSRLLSLPAELRNEIYRHALCSSLEVTIAATGYTEPSLLQVCQQIRHEAGPIYYVENEFYVHAPGFEPTAILQFERRAGKVVRVENLKYCADTYAPTYRWSDLMHWLKAFFEEHATAYEMSDDSPPDEDEPDWVGVKAL